MLCMLVRLLITSSTRSSVNEDRLESLAAIEVSLYNRQQEVNKNGLEVLTHQLSIWLPA